MRESFALATDVAEVVSDARGIDYRSAYRVVGARGRRRDARRGRARHSIPPCSTPVAALATRTVTGGAAPAPMDAMLAECRAAVAGARAVAASGGQPIGAAEAELVALASG